MYKIMDIVPRAGLYYKHQVAIAMLDVVEYVGYSSIYRLLQSKLGGTARCSFSLHHTTVDVRFGALCLPPVPSYHTGFSGGMLPSL